MYLTAILKYHIYLRISQALELSIVFIRVPLTSNGIRLGFVKT